MNISREEERARIRDAMARLLEGKPIRSTGSLSVVSLAKEADVKRVALTHRHDDLREEFNDRVKALGKLPPNEAALIARVADLRSVVNDKEDELSILRTEAKTWARLVRALELDNDALRRELGKPPLRGVPRAE